MTMATNDQRGEVANERDRSAARRARHDPGTKQARKGYEKGMVWARFCPPSTCTTPAPISACAAAKNILFRDVTDLPNEPTPRAARYPLSSTLYPPLRASVPLADLPNEPTICVHLRPS